MNHRRNQIVSADNNATITGSLFWSFMEQGSSKAIALIVQIVLARILTPEAFGVLAILLVITHLADSIAQSGLGAALVQKNDADDKSYSTGWWLSLGIAVILYVAMALMAPSIAVFYSMPELAYYLRVLGLVVIVNSANSIQRSWLQRSMSFRGLFKVSLTAIILSGCLGIACAFLGLEVWALIIQSLAQSLFTLIAMLIVVPWKPRIVFQATEAKELFSYGWKICVTGILNVLYTGVSELVIGRACSAGELGYYSQGRKYPQAAIGVMTNAIANVLFPAFSAIKSDRAALHRSMRKGLRIGTFVVAPVSLLFAATAEPIVAILLTEKWLPCVFIFQLTCASNAVLLLQLVNLRAYMALGDSSLYLKLQIIKVLFGGGSICIAAIATHDIYITAVVTFLVGVLSVVLVDMHPARHVHGYSRASQLKDTMPSICLSIAVAVLTWSIGQLALPYALLLVIQVVVFCAAYILGAKALGFTELAECFQLARRYGRVR